MRKILLATDGSEPALEAEKYVSEVFDSSTDDVLVVTVAKVPELVSSYGGASGHEAEMLGMDPDNFDEELTEQAGKTANDAAARLRSEGFDVTVLSTIGDPGMQICKMAEENDVDCIVMGRRGLSKISEVLIGSVSHYVLHHAPCAVNIIPGNE